MNSTTDLLTRITQTPGQCGGRPCIRGMGIRVTNSLEMLAENARTGEQGILTNPRPNNSGLPVLN